jgi:signal transduction histidine kinase
VDVQSAQLGGTEPLQGLQGLTDVALAHLDLDNLLEALAERTREALGTDICAVLLLEDEASELVVRAVVGGDGQFDRGDRFPIGSGLAGRVAAEAQPLMLDEVEEPGVLGPLGIAGLASGFGVPLVARGAVLGVLVVGTLAPSRFGNDAVELLRLAGDRMAVAIEHARSFEAERRARERLEHVQTVTDAALAHLELDELLAVLLPKVRAILRADTCAVLLLDDETNELVARAALGIEEEVEQGVRIPIGQGFAGRVAAERAPIVLGDVDQAHVLNPILREKGLKSLLGVPLLVRGEAIGVLHVGTLVHRDFERGDVELLQLVSERVALAIERAQLHEQALSFDRLKANFVAVASHELRTPATAVYGVFATLDARGEELSPELREELMRVGYEQADRLRRLLEELLDLSRLDTHTISLEPRPIVLRSVVAAIVQQAVPSGSAVEIEIPEDLAVVVDPIVLDRVLSNLLINAVRYGAPPIVVALERRGQHLRLVVEDGGEGVSEELQPRLFERFASGGGSGGTGLGLAIARAYARAHGGDVIYEPHDRGGRFELILPTG